MAVEKTVNAELERIKEQAEARINLAKELRINERGMLIIQTLGKERTDFNYRKEYIEEIGNLYLLDKTGTHEYRRKILIINQSDSDICISLIDKQTGFMRRKTQKKKVYWQYENNLKIFRDEKDWLSHFERIYEKAVEMDKDRKEQEILALRAKFGLED